MKIFSLIIFLALMMQFMTFHFFASFSLYYAIVKNRETLVCDEPDILLVSEYNKQINISRVKGVLGQNYENVGFYNKKTIQLFDRKRVVVYVVETKITSFFTAQGFDTNIYKKIGEDGVYAEDYKGMYIWVLFKWISLNHENTGQT